MPDSAVPVPPPSLVGTTVRRSIVVGRTYLALGTGISVLYAVLLAFIGQSAFESAFPLVLPVVAGVGGLGGMIVFTNDRVKGVFEYLLAYGLSPLGLFVNTLIACLALESVVLGATCAVGLGVYLARGNPFTWTLASGLGLYAVPMSYAAISLAATTGMFWTSLSSPREGMNSPLGLLPMVGIAPPLLTLLVSGVIAVRTEIAPATIAWIAIALVAVTVVVLLRLASRLMRAERLLSPA